MSQPRPWLGRLDRRPGDEEAARKATCRLYEVLGRPVPKTLLWLPSPYAGLLAHASLHRTRGPLWEGADPPLLHALMREWGILERTDYESELPNPDYEDIHIGRKLSSRWRVTAAALQRAGAALVAGEPPSLPVPGLELDLPSLPRVLKELGQAADSRFCGRYVRSFAFDPAQVSYRSDGSRAYTLFSPRCLDFDRLAERLYGMDNVVRRGGHPEWFELLIALAGAAGWLWPFDDVAILCAPPRESEFARDDVVDGAVRYPDGWTAWALHGQEVRSLSVTPLDVVAERDEETRRMMVARLGPDALWPPQLAKLVRMVFEQQYHRFENGPWGAKVAPWPQLVPVPLKSSLDCPGLADGLYSAVYPSGQLHMLAGVEGGQIAAWMWLADGRAEAWHQAGRMAQKYFPDGRVEDFSPWDDSSKPYFQEKSFEEWVQESLDQLVGSWKKSRR